MTLNFHWLKVQYLIEPFVSFDISGDMGIQEHEARSVLSKENWNLEKATENLFS